MRPIKKQVHFPHKMTPDSERSFRSNFSMLNTSVYVYLLVMAGLFFNQAWISIDKYLEMEVVEDVKLHQSLTAVMPPFTLCLAPGYKRALDPLQMQQFDIVCPGATEENVTKCFEEQRFHLPELVLLTFRYPGVLETLEPDYEANWHRNSLNLAMGWCFTHQQKEPDTYSMASADFLILNMSNPWLSSGYSVFLYVHPENMFIPSIGMSPEFNGQRSIIISPKLDSIVQLTTDVTSHKRLSTDDRPCIDKDKEDDYSVVRCMEQFVNQKVGCRSPWNLYQDDQLEVCTTPDQFRATYNLHLAIFTAGGPQFQNLTSCLPPCDYDSFDDLSVRTYENPHIMAMFEEQPVSAVAISLRSTNRKMVKEAWFYQLHNLVGEVGGCLGMFLGISLVSIYQMTVGAVRSAFNYISVAK